MATFLKTACSVLIVMLVSVSFVPTALLGAAKCPTGFSTCPCTGNCYLIGEPAKRVTRDTARQACRDANSRADLVAIETAIEFMCLRNMLASRFRDAVRVARPFFTGAETVAKKTQWISTDGNYDLPGLAIDALPARRLCGAISILPNNAGYKHKSFRCVLQIGNIKMGYICEMKPQVEIFRAPVLPENENDFDGW